MDKMKFEGDFLEDLKDLNKYTKEGLTSDEIDSINDALSNGKLEIIGETKKGLSKLVNEMIRVGFKPTNKREYESVSRLLEKNGITIPTFSDVFKKINTSQKPFKLVDIKEEDIIEIVIKDGVVSIKYNFFWNIKTDFVSYDDNGGTIESVTGFKKDDKSYKKFDGDILDKDIKILEKYYNSLKKDIPKYNNLLVNNVELLGIKRVKSNAIPVGIDTMDIKELEILSEELPTKIQKLEKDLIIYSREKIEEDKELERSIEKDKLEREIDNIINDMLAIFNKVDLYKKSIELNDQVLEFNLGGKSKIDPKRITEAYDEQLMVINIQKKVETKLSNEAVIEKYINPSDDDIKDKIKPVEEPVEELEEPVKKVEKHLDVMSRVDKYLSDYKKKKEGKLVMSESISVEPKIINVDSSIKEESIIKKPEVLIEKETILVDKNDKEKNRIDINDIDHREYKKSEKFYMEKGINIRGKSDKIFEIQDALEKLGYDFPIYGTDSNFGKETYTAIINFQTNRGLKVDGKAGTVTLGELGINKTSKQFYI